MDIWGSIQHVRSKQHKYNYEIITPYGRRCKPPTGSSWRVSKEKFQELIKDNRIWFGKDGNNIPRLKRFLSDVKEGITATTLWTRKEVDDNEISKKEIKDLFPEEKKPISDT